jgi:hypothetical protein
MATAAEGCAAVLFAACRCMPIPKDCGASGKSCCPGNAIQPITNASAPAPKPVCNDGSYCFYTPTPDASGWSSPPYSSPANLLGEY